MAQFGKVKFWLFIGIAVVVFLPPFAKYQELRYKNNKLEQDLKDLRAEIKRLQVNKVRLETDMTYIEGRARDKIGLVRKGEIVLKEPEKR